LPCRQGLCDQVVTIRLDRQQLTSVPVAAFARLRNARSLHLQHNRLTALLPLAPSLPALRFLSLARNELTSIEACNALNELMTLDVSHNRLAALEPAHFPVALRFLRVCAGTATGSLPVAASFVFSCLPKQRRHKTCRYAAT
jgi:Leucine-rich repeat (LRR) protein